jgi:hypothetical protein
MRNDYSIRPRAKLKKGGVVKRKKYFFGGMMKGAIKAAKNTIPKIRGGKR